MPMLRSKLLGAEGAVNIPGVSDTTITGSSTVSFIGKSKRAGVLTVAGVGAFAATSPSPALDAVSAPTLAFGFRRLLSSYATNKAVRIRRSSDDTEQDIGFDGTGAFDSAAFTSFVGAGHAYVRTWYDQSGNGYDAEQTTAANQPELVLSGIGGKPAMLFGVGSSKALVVPSVTGIDNPFTAGGGTINGVWSLTGD